MIGTATKQRRFTRIQLNRSAVLESPRESVAGRLRDISLSGARLELLGAWTTRPDSRYRLTAELAPGASVSMQLVLVYRYNTTAGFYCERLDAISLGHLRRLLILYYGDTAAVDREIEAVGQLPRQD